MKNIKIVMLLFFLMGFISAFSQQASTGLYDSKQQKATAVQQDRSTLSPNPTSGDPAIKQNSDLSAGTKQSTVKAVSAADAESSPNKPSDPASPAKAFSNSQVNRNVEKVGPSPNDPNGRKPDTK